MKHTNNYFYVECNGDKKKQQHRALSREQKNYRDQIKFSDNSSATAFHAYRMRNLAKKKEVCGVIKLIAIRQTSGYFSKYSK